MDETGPTPPAETNAPVNDGAIAGELEQVREERDQFKDRWLRAAADLENFRKRMHREIAEQRMLMAVEVVRDLLPVLDGFDRALEHAAGGPGEMSKGLELLRRQMLEGLRRAGVEALETQGAAFNPHLHEAIEMVDTTVVPDQTIVEELQRGYKLRERLIRPAMVKVARAPRL